MRSFFFALGVVIPVSVSCDAESRNQTARKVGQALGGATHEIARTTEEMAKAAMEESQKKRQEELGTPEEQTQRILRQVREDQHRQRMRNDKGFPGHASGQGFPGHEK